MERNYILKKLNIDGILVDKIEEKDINDEHVIVIKLNRDFKSPKIKDRKNVRAYGWETRVIKCNVYDDEITPVIIKYPRYQYKDSKVTFSDSNVLCSANQKVSLSLVKKTLKYLKRITMTYDCVSEIVHLSIQEVIDIFDKFVECPRGKLTNIICIDECHNKDQFKNKKYSVIISDFISHNILDIIVDRRIDTLTNYFNKICPKELLNVEFVIMDMWKTYKEISRKFFPNAIIAIDSFHVLQLIKTCIKDMEMEIYHRLKEGSKEKKLLKKYFNQIIDYKINHQKISYEINIGQRLSTFEIKNEIMAIDKKLAEAIKFLDDYKLLNRTCSFKEFDEKFAQLIKENPIFHDECFTSIRTMFSDWYQEIKNSFQRIITNSGNNEVKRLSNGLAESLNNLYKELMRVSNGVKNFSRFRKRLMYCINKSLNYINGVLDRF